MPKPYSQDLRERVSSVSTYCIGPLSRLIRQSLGARRPVLLARQAGPTRDPLTNYERRQ